MCNKTINTDPSTIKFVYECYNTPEICDEAVDTCFLHLILIPMDVSLMKCVTVVFEDPSYAKILSLQI